MPAHGLNPPTPSSQKTEWCAGSTNAHAGPGARLTHLGALVPLHFPLLSLYSLCCLFTLLLPLLTFPGWGEPVSRTPTWRKARPAPRSPDSTEGHPPFSLPHPGHLSGPCSL